MSEYVSPISKELLDIIVDIQKKESNLHFYYTELKNKMAVVADYQGRAEKAVQAAADFKAKLLETERELKNLKRDLQDELAPEEPESDLTREATQETEQDLGRAI